MGELPINKNFFSPWTPEMSYVLGLIVADGNLVVKRIKKDGTKQYSLDITSKDLLLLKKIRKAMGAQQKIGEKQSGYNKEKKCYKIQVGHQKICNDLLNLGIKPRKTYEPFTVKIPQKYFPDFARGFFDGDGTVFIYKVNNVPQIKARFKSTNFSFIAELNRQLCKALNIFEKSIHLELPQKNKVVQYYIDFYIDDCEKLYQLMYGNNPVLYLPRKRRVFERWKSVKRRHYIKQNYPSKIGWHLNQSYRLSSYSKIST